MGGWWGGKKGVKKRKRDRNVRKLKHEARCDTWFGWSRFVSVRSVSSHSFIHHVVVRPVGRPAAHRACVRVGAPFTQNPNPFITSTDNHIPFHSLHHAPNSATLRWMVASCSFFSARDCCVDATSSGGALDRKAVPERRFSRPCCVMLELGGFFGGVGWFWLGLVGAVLGG